MVLTIYIGIWEYGNMVLTIYVGIWEYGNMGIWEYEDHRTHISATAELVAYIHVPIQAMLDSYTNKAFFYY